MLGSTWIVLFCFPLSGSTPTIIDAGGSDHRHFIIDPNVRVTFINIHFTGGYKETTVLNPDASRGGAMRIGSGATVTIDNCKFTNNQNVVPTGGTSVAQGGAILNSGTLNIINSIFENNNVEGRPGTSAQGGAIYNKGTLNIEGSTFNNNNAKISGILITAKGDGGAIYTEGSTTITSSIFSRNNARDNGGAIYTTGSTTITSSELSYNKAGNQGGAIYFDQITTTVKVNYCYIIENTAKSNGDGNDLFVRGPNNPFGTTKTTLDANYNFWGNNDHGGTINRISDSGRKDVYSNIFYQIYVITDALPEEYLIGDELPYEIVAYLVGTTDRTGSERLPEIPLVLYYTSSNPNFASPTIVYHPVTGQPITGMWEATLVNGYYSDYKTIMGEYSTITLHPKGIPTNWLGPLNYRSSKVYKPFIINLGVSYQDAAPYGTYGKTSTINGQVVNIYNQPIIGGVVSIEIEDYGTVVLNNPSQFDGKDFILTITNTFTGVKGVTIRYDNTGAHPRAGAIDTTKQLIVYDTDLTVTITVSEGTYGSNNGVISGTVTGVVSGDTVKIGIYHKGTLIGTIEVTADGSFEVDDILVNIPNDFKYYLKILTGSDGYYNLIGDIKNIFDVSPAELTITVSDAEGTYGADGVVSGSVTGVVAGDDVYLDIVIDGVTVDTIKVNPDGTFSYTVNGIEYTSNVDLVIRLNSVASDGYYSLNDFIGTFVVNPSDLTIDNVVSTGTYGGNGVITGTVDGVVGSDDVYLDIYLDNTYLGRVKVVTGKFSLDVSGISYTNNVIFRIELNSDSDGFYNLGMIQKGTRSTDTTGVFTVNPGNLIITVNSSNGIYGKNGYISGLVTGLVFNDKLVLKTTINGVDYYANVNSDGSFTFNLGVVNFTTQNYLITMNSVTGLYNFANSSNTFTVAKDQLISTLTITENTDGTTTLNIKLTDSSNNPVKYHIVKVLVNGIVVSTVITDELGMAMFTLPDGLVAGYHKISILAGNENYEDHTNVIGYTKSDNDTNPKNNETEDIIPTHASMKNTSIPLVAVLMVLLSSLIVLIRKK